MRSDRLPGQRGIALPTALLALLILSALMVAFTLLASTEPLIADNHARAARARALAEAGLERAIWASTVGSTDPTVPGTIAETALGTENSEADPPYDGSAFFSVSSDGGFTLRVSRPAGFPANERRAEAIGWSPDNASDGTPRGVRKVEATLMRVRWIDPRCALCVRGDLEMAGNSSVDARAGQCPGGPPPAGGTMTSGATEISGNAKVWGPGNDVPNESADKPANVPLDTFAQMQLTDSDLAALKELARARGTYYRGSVTFDPSNPMPDGLVFVDTTTGSPFTSSTPDSEAGVANIHGGTTWSGWLVVAGTINISGNVTLTGLLYAQNVINYSGTGTGGVTGAAISENLKYIQSTIVRTGDDAGLTGNARIIYDCQAVRDGGGTLRAWVVKPGTYREVEGRTF